jgi:hypothetical protein
VAALLDVIGAMVLGGMLLLNVLNAQSIMAENSSMFQGDVLVQEMLISQVQAVEGEFRNMGYGVPQGTRSIISATDTSITFLIDASPRDGKVDTVSYSTGPTSELSGTQNEMDRYLRRVVHWFNGTLENGNVGVVTYFHVRYIDATQDTIATPVTGTNLNRIKEVEISMEVQNPYALYRPRNMVYAGERDALFSTSYWQQTRLASQNFKR